MSARLSIRPIALLLALAAVGVTTSARAEKSGRLIMLGRQQVRGRLAAALADGTLSKHEEHSILLEARSALPADDLRGVQSTLARISKTHGEHLQLSKRAQTVKGSSSVKSAGSMLAGFIAKGSGKSADRQVVRSFQAENPFHEEDGEEPPVPADGLGEFEENGEFVGDTVFDDPEAVYYSGWDSIELFSLVTSFRNPIDLNGQTGNSGIAFGFNGGFPLLEERGLGLQVGTSAVLTDFHGWQYAYGGATFNSSKIRSQNFTTCGLFTRESRLISGLSWGFAYDWLVDDYYDRLTMGRWRVKFAYELGLDDEIGLWVSIPDFSANATIGDINTGQETAHFKACTQGNLYWRHYWETGANTRVWIGAIEEPGEVVLGADAQYPLGENLALVGTFNYVDPSASGIAGQSEEMWNVAVGIAILPGNLSRGSRPARFSPLLPIADNGNFLVRRF